MDVVRAQAKDARTLRTGQVVSIPPNAYGGKRTTKMIVRNSEATAMNFQSTYYSLGDPPIDILRDYECREFDCSYGWTEDSCGQFKDCVFDKKDSSKCTHMGWEGVL